MNEKEVKKKDYRDRKEHFEGITKQVKIFIDTREREHLKELLDKPWSFEAIYDYDWFIKNRIENRITLPEMAEELNNLISKETQPNEKKIEAIPGMGHATTTEILHAFYPDNYPIWNRRSETLIEMVDGKIRMPRTSDAWKKYKCFIDRVNKICIRCRIWKQEDEEVVGESIPNYAFFDKIATDLWDKKVGLDEINKYMCQREKPEGMDIEWSNKALPLTLLNLINSMEKQEKEPEQIVQKLKVVLNEFVV